jgi:hypothetical protein
VLSSSRARASWSKEHSARGSTKGGLPSAVWRRACVRRTGDGLGVGAAGLCPYPYPYSYPYP